MKKLILLATLLITATTFTAQAGVQAFEVTPEWTAKITSLAPTTPTATVKRPRRALLFSRMTGYKHWVTPHTAEMVKVLGDKSGAFDVVQTDNVDMFTPVNIKQFDIIILNNNCSDRKKRDLFWDATQDEAKAAMLEKSLIDHIAAGAGLVNIHGAITMQNNSKAFSRMVGGSFDFHPKQQEVTCHLVDPNHPIVKPFEGQPLVHVDEPYLFKNAYKDKNFLPLLEMDTATLDCGKKTKAVRSDKRYVAWIKRHEKGRVFYCSPSHNAQSFENPALLQFILNGIQYAAGDLECEDGPLKETTE
ncbi:MAG: ThuA domain-containing protein [Verrucomicrobia bacterium]|nr:ThuA domain-containing protein [Verrucomicrobiota bacterium]